MSRLYHFGDFALDPRRRLLTTFELERVSITSRLSISSTLLFEPQSTDHMKDELLRNPCGATLSWKKGT